MAVILIRSRNKEAMKVVKLGVACQFLTAADVFIIVKMMMLFIAFPEPKLSYIFKI
jgi:hypothetical protein